MKQEQILRAALAGLVAAGIAAATQPRLRRQGRQRKVRRYRQGGQERLRHFDQRLRRSGHQGQPSGSLIFVPTGVCERISGGRLVTGSQAGKTGTSTKG